MSNLKKKFYFELSQLEKNVPNSKERCLDLLREINSTPMYSLGEMQPIVNGAMKDYCKATGESCESVAMIISMGKF